MNTSIGSGAPPCNKLLRGLAYQTEPFSLLRIYLYEEREREREEFFIISNENGSVSYERPLILFQTFQYFKYDLFEISYFTI